MQTDTHANEPTLLTENQGPVNSLQSVMCTFTASTNATATIFQYDGADFFRVASTVPKENGTGDLATCTNLDQSSFAYSNLIQGLSYSGEVTLFGTVYQVSFVRVYLLIHY